MRETPSIASEHGRMEGPVLPNGYVSSPRQGIPSPHRATLYQRPQVEDGEESEAGNALVEGDNMVQD